MCCRTVSFRLLVLAGSVVAATAPQPPALIPAETILSGDTMLFASDGLAEQANEAGEVFGYEAASEAFAEAAGKAATEVVERLARRLAEWRGAADQSDDTTLVVVRAVD